MDTLLLHLEAIHPMPAPLKLHLQQILQHRIVKKKEFLLKKGQTCSHICFIQGGLLHCFFTEKDKKISSWFLQEGEVAISVRSFFSQQPSYESIQALEDCEIYYISYGQLQELYQLFPAFNFIGRVLTEKYYMLKDEHSYQLQKTYARERLNWFISRFPDLLLRIPSRYVATFLGVTEETLSRIRASGKKP